MAFYIYRDGQEVKIHKGDSDSAKLLYKKFGDDNFGNRPYDNEKDAEEYKQRWQRDVIADPKCKPPYSAYKG
jgi:NADH:ubiquinone oxidoreductase subunit